MKAWTWASGFSAALAVVFSHRGEWWLAALYAVASAFAWVAPQCFPPEGVEDGTESFRRVRRHGRKK